MAVPKIRGKTKREAGMVLHRMARWLLAALLAIPTIAAAQTPSTPATSASAPATNNQLLSSGQLEALVSPIALYPDSLLSNVLMASTYPLEVVQAERWLNQNKNLSGDALRAAVNKQTWDESVKALIATPSALAMMNSEIDWTQKLGDAVLAQQPEVAAAIQRLRLRAEDNGKLMTTPQQTVTVLQDGGGGGQRTVVIEQASDDTVYVPAYDPGVVFGSWPYPEYPPYYWGYPDYWGYGVGAGVLARGLWFGAGYALGNWGSGGYGWGGRVNWGNGGIVRNWPRATPYNVTNINNIGNRVGNNWQHNPSHRLGVGYNNSNVAQRFGDANRAAQRGNLANNRGNLGGNLAAGAGGLAAGAALRGAANRQGAGAGNRAGNRQAGNRAQAGNRQAGNRQAGNRQAGNRQAANRQAGNRQAANRQAGNRQAANRQAGNRQAANRPAGNRQAQRPSGGNRQAFRGGGGGGGFRGGAGARASVGRAGGGFGGGGGGRGGGGRRSDIALKHDIVLLGHLDDGLGFYRFVYNGSDKPYVGVIAQEVQSVVPSAVTQGRDGYLRVDYGKIGVKFETYDAWMASGAHVPAGPHVH
jgi:hypothetical protein